MFFDEQNHPSCRKVSSLLGDGADDRILCYVDNRSDRPGRYLYLRDNASGDFWSAC